MKNLFTIIFIFCATISYGQDATYFNAVGDEYWDKGEYKSAITFYTKAIQTTKEALYYFNRGFCYNSLNEYDNALRDYTTAIQLDGNFFDAYFHRGFLHNHLRDYPQAINDYSKALKINPKSADAYNSRGYAQLRLKEYELAISDFNKAIKYNSKLAAAYNNRGSAKHNMGEFESAIIDFDKAISIDNTNPRFYDNRGTTKFEFGEYEAALLDYNMVLKLDPKRIQTYYNQGAVYEKLERYDEAVIAFKKVTAIDPSHYGANVKIDDINWRNQQNQPKETENLTLVSTPVKEDIKMSWAIADIQKYRNKSVYTSSIILNMEFETDETIDTSKIVIINNNKQLFACNQQFKIVEGNKLTINLCLKLGSNRIYVAYDEYSMSYGFNVTYRIAKEDKNNSSIMAIAVPLPDFNCGKANMIDLEKSVNAKSSFLFAKSSVSTNYQESLSARKIKNLCAEFKLKINNNTTKNDEDVAILYLCSKAILHKGEILIKGSNFDTDKLEYSLKKATFTVDDIFKRTQGISNNKILILNFIIDDNIPAAELKVITDKLLAKAKQYDWILIIAISNENKCSGTNTTFGKHLMAGMSNTANVNHDAVISLRELTNYIQLKQPYISISDFENDFYIIVI